MSEFDDRIKRWLIHALASFLEISPEDVQIKAIRSGSVYVTIAMPSDAAARLVKAGTDRNSGLTDYLDGLKVAKVAYAQDHGRRLVEVPFFGRIAAGRPIESISSFETISVPTSLLEVDYSAFYALRVVGESLIEAGIFDGDMIIVERTTTATTGDLAVVLVGDDATLKYYYPGDQFVTLKPANSTMSAIQVPAKDVRIQGKVRVILRKF